MVILLYTIRLFVWRSLFQCVYTLVDGQGNFGSVDGDSAAAMRYTEIRMAKIAHHLLMDLEKETVDFVPNYDGTEFMPSVMPSRVPGLLVNGFCWYCCWHGD